MSSVKLHVNSKIYKYIVFFLLLNVGKICRNAHITSSFDKQADISRIIGSFCLILFMLEIAALGPLVITTHEREWRDPVERLLL